MIDFQNGEIMKLRQADMQDVGSLVGKILLPGEQVVGVYKTVRDRVIFTDRRVMTLDIQGATGKKQEVTSLPYRKIVCFSVETSGILDVDSELELCFSGMGRVRFEFFGSSHIAEIAQVLGKYIL